MDCSAHSANVGDHFRIGLVASLRNDNKIFRNTTYTGRSTGSLGVYVTSYRRGVFAFSFGYRSYNPRGKLDAIAQT